MEVVHKIVLPDDLFRCTEEVSAWTSEVSWHIKNTEEGLLEALEQMHKGVEVNPHLKYQFHHPQYLTYFKE